MHETDASALSARLAGTLASYVERALGVLVGEPLVHITRAADMICLGFGREVHAPTRRDPHRTMPRYALHIQCPMRLDHRGWTIVGARDVYLDPADPDGTADDFDYDRAGTNLFDVNVAAFLAEHRPGRLRCERVEGDGGGGVRLHLTDEHVISVFPNSAVASEHWRFFEAGDGSRHVVIFEADD